MLTYLFKSFTGPSAPIEQKAADPSKELIVVSDKEQEDDFCEISVRPMTWSEVAGGGRANSKVVVSHYPPSCDAGPAVEMYPAAPAVRSLALESNELYGDIEDSFAAKTNRIGRRRKSHGRKRRARIERGQL